MVMSKAIGRECSDDPVSKDEMAIKDIECFLRQCPTGKGIT